jgi:peptidoglycan-N-acetylglucosamine deacetylase
VRKKCLIGMLICSLCFPVYCAQAHSSIKTCKTVAAPGTVALTFDDGPSMYTSRVLSILEKNHIKATFFVIGKNAERRPMLLKKMSSDGDIIGNHTYSHPNTSKLSKQQFYQQIVKPENIVYSITGQKPQLFRFPYGSGTERERQVLKSQGLMPVFWSYTPDDFKRPGANVIARSVIQHAHSGGVILLHDGPARRQQTVTALPKIIQGVKGKGLGFSVLCS